VEISTNAAVLKLFCAFSFLKLRLALFIHCATSEAR
jgi:hypothetical protein